MYQMALQNGSMVLNKKMAYQGLRRIFVIMKIQPRMKLKNRIIVERNGV
jgi:hypothetical protein